MKLTKKRLDEIKAEAIPHLDWKELFSPKDGKTYDEIISKEEQEKLTEYFSRFADMGIAARVHFNLYTPCIGCGLEMDNGLMGWLLGGGGIKTRLEWGLANGEGYCVNCHWPYRVYHREIGPINFLEHALPYHPDGIKIKE